MQKRRLTVFLDDASHAALLQRASVQRLEAGLLASRALRSWLGAEQDRSRADSAPASQQSVTQIQLLTLASLIATEQVSRFLAKVHPEGELRMLELRDAAVGAAERHLEELKEQLDGEAAV